MFGFGREKKKGAVPFNVYSVRNDGRAATHVSLLPHEISFESGLPPECIVGELITPVGEGGELEPENFARNSIFVDYLHDFIARTASRDPGLVEAGRSGGLPYLYLIDQRTPTPHGEVPPEDILGAFRVENGQISEASYEGNRQNHRILSHRGFFNLGEAMMAELISEQERIARRFRPDAR